VLCRITIEPVIYLEHILTRLTNRISCTVLAVVCVCSAVACSTGSRKSEAELQADKATADRVEAALNADKVLFARHILVRADNGVVQLSGFVWDQPDLVEAVRVARSVQGVSRVVDALELQRNGIGNSNVTR
jgi:osmotically-inducible protein OsmY